MDPAFRQHQHQCKAGEERPPRQKQYPAHHIQFEDSSRGADSSEQTSGELQRSRSLSPKCVQSVCCLQPSLSMPSDESRRSEYNRFVGNTLLTDSRQDIQDTVAQSLRIMDYLLTLVGEAYDSCPDGPK